jgi:translocation and assembly module TamA
VRGYAYRSLSPLGPYQQIIGGRSLLEPRPRHASRSPTRSASCPSSTPAPPSIEPAGRQAEAADGRGLGFRYYTGIGPIRVDIAAPLNPRKGDKPVALYVSIGQAF